MKLYRYVLLCPVEMLSLSHHWWPDMLDITGRHSYWSGEYYTALTSVQCELSSLPHLTWALVTQKMISLYPTTIFLLSLLTQAIASLATPDTEEVEEVLYKDANTVQTFMRTREFKVSS